MQCSVESVTRLPDSRVQVSGELDLVAAPQVHSAVTRALGAGCTRVLLDLGAVTFMDCTGVSIILVCAEEVRAVGAELRVTAMSPRVVRLLHLTGTADRLVLVPEPA